MTRKKYFGVRGVVLEVVMSCYHVTPIQIGAYPSKSIHCVIQYYPLCCSIYILLDVLLCSIAEYFYELCGILTSP